MKRYSLPCVNLKVVFRIKNRVNSKFTFKDKVSKEMCFLLCYKLQCSSCNATYYGKIKRHFKVRVSEHMGVSARTGKNIKSTKNSVVRDHMLVCNNTLSFEDFSVLANGTNDFKIKLQESLSIHRDGPQLNHLNQSLDVILLRRIIFVALHQCITLQGPLISDY